MSDEEVNQFAKNLYSETMARINEKHKAGEISKDDKYFILMKVSSMLDEEGLNLTHNQ